MSAGDKELRQAFEETATRNINAVLNHGNETRAMIKSLEQQVKNLDVLVRSRDNEIKELRSQLSIVQGKLYAGGTV